MSMVRPAQQWLILQHVLNAILRLDEEAMPALAHLSGRYVLVQVRDPSFQFCLAPDADGLLFVDEEAVVPDVILRCRMVDFFPLLFSRAKGAGVLSKDMEFSGDIHILHELQKVMARFSPDWQEPLSHVLGDTVSYRLLHAASFVHRRLTGSGRQLCMDLSEYLRYEKRLLPDANELVAFYSAVDDLRSDVDRLEKHLQALLQTMPDNEDVSS